MFVANFSQRHQISTDSRDTPLNVSDLLPLGATRLLYTMDALRFITI